MGFLALSLATSSFWLLAAGGVIAGLGQGLSFRAALSAVVEMTPARQRAEASSVVLVVAYFALCVSVIGVGVLTQITDLRTAGFAFTGVVAAISAAGAYRTTTTIEGER
jgi:predicted MFS family arabinose efflux permease